MARFFGRWGPAGCPVVETVLEENVVRVSNTVAVAGRGASQCLGTMTLPINPTMNLLAESHAARSQRHWQCGGKARPACRAARSINHPLSGQLPAWGAVFSGSCWMDHHRPASAGFPPVTTSSQANHGAVGRVALIAACCGCGPDAGRALPGLHRGGPRTWNCPTGWVALRSCQRGAICGGAQRRPATSVASAPSRCFTGQDLNFPHAETPTGYWQPAMALVRGDLEPARPWPRRSPAQCPPLYKRNAPARSGVSSRSSPRRLVGMVGLVQRPSPRVTGPGLEAGGDTILAAGRARWKPARDKPGQASLRDRTRAGRQQVIRRAVSMDGSRAARPRTDLALECACRFGCAKRSARPAGLRPRPQRRRPGRWPRP